MLIALEIFSAASSFFIVTVNGKPFAINSNFTVKRMSVCQIEDEVSVQSEELGNIYQRYSYKRLPPEATDQNSVV